MGLRYETLGQYPNHRRIVIADTEAELLAADPATEVAEGYAKDTGINADWVRGIGWKVGGFQRVGDTLVSNSPISAPKNTALRRSAPIARWEAHPTRPEDTVSATLNATCQINIVSPIEEWTHIMVEMENKAATDYSGIKNIIAAVSSDLKNAHPSTGKDVTGNPRTGWVSVDLAPTVPARPGGVEYGSGYWQSNKIYLPSHYAGASLYRNKVVCLRYWMESAGSTYKLLTDGGATTPPSVFVGDELGNHCWVRRDTGRTTNVDCIAGTAEASGDRLNALGDGTSTQIMRVYFFNGSELIGTYGRRISVEICGASTLSQQGVTSSGGRPWIGLANSTLRPRGITLGYAGRGGSTTAQYLAAAKARLNSALGQYALYPVFAGNDPDPYTEATSILQVQRFFEFAEYALSKNIVPIGIIMCHDGVGAVGSDGYTARDNSIAVLLNCGMAMIDARQWVGRPDARNLMVPALTIDGTHTNTDGDAVMAENFPSALEAVINAFPPMK